MALLEFGIWIFSLLLDTVWSPKINCSSILVKIRKMNYKVTLFLIKRKCGTLTWYQNYECFNFNEIWLSE